VGATYNLNEAGQGVLDANGHLAVFVAPGSYERWNITRVAVITDDPATATVIPRCDLYLDSVGPSNFVGGTWSGNNDASDEDLVLERNQRLYAVWTGGTAGRNATVSVFGTRESY
jgi:hypothetical protein